MKLPAAQIERFLAAPDARYRAVLVYGPDSGLVRERADRMAAAIVPDRNDPFRVADLAAETLVGDPARLYDEAQALSLMPGRRVVRVREAGDPVGALFDRFLKEPPPGDTLIVVEGGDLPARSSLRRAFEAARGGAALACYADGPQELAALVRAVMGERRIIVSADAMDHLVANLGGDRLLSRHELDKLALYVGDGGKLGIDEAAAMVGDSAAVTVEDAVYAAAEGDVPGLERALGRAFGDGETAVSLIRAAQRHFQRLHLAGERLRPPVFFKRRERFQGQLRRWPARRAVAALEALLEAERNAKRTGLPPETVCRDALLRLAAAGRRSASRA